MATSDFEAGQESAAREFRADRWTPASARTYLDACVKSNCAEGRSEFDRGFMAAVRDLAAR